MTQQLNQEEPEGVKNVMDETYDKSMPIHNPAPKPDGPQEVYPFRKEGVGGTAEKDFRPINSVNYDSPAAGEDTISADGTAVTSLDAGTTASEAAEVDEVLSAPKDLSAPASAPSLKSDQSPAIDTQKGSDSSAPAASPASAEKDSGQPKESESGSPTSSLPPMIGDVELPASTQPQTEESQTPGSPAKQS